jgi:hypothetical protein
MAADDSGFPSDLEARFSGKAAYERFISRSHSIMQSISEISDLRWVTEREWQELSRRTNPKGEQAVHGNTH